MADFFWNAPFGAFLRSLCFGGKGAFFMHTLRRGSYAFTGIRSGADKQVRMKSFPARFYLAVKKKEFFKE